MSRLSKPVILTFTFLGFAAACGLALAAQGDHDNDALAVIRAPLTLAQAVATAEQHAHGRASRAEYENSKQGWVYDVEVVSGTQVFDVKVDAAKGGVLASTADAVDRDDEHDARD